MARRGWRRWRLHLAAALSRRDELALLALATEAHATRVSGAIFSTYPVMSENVAPGASATDVPGRRLSVGTAGAAGSSCCRLQNSSDSG